MALVDIESQLKAPFALDDIDFLPKGKVERDGKTLCMALPYADPRVYQDRLNSVAYGEWSTPAPVVLVAGNKLICYVTVIVCGVPHTDVGEATNNEENTGTEAFAQGFKRACSQFGLGRYLYDLEKEWVPFNPQKKQIDLDKAGKSAIVRKMYQKAGIAVPGQPKQAAPAAVEAPTSMLQEVKATFLKLFKAEKWESFKVGVLGMPVADAGLAENELVRLMDKLIEIKSGANAGGGR